MKYLGALPGIILAFLVQAFSPFSIAWAQSSPVYPYFVFWNQLQGACSPYIYDVSDLNQSLWTCTGSYWRPVGGHHTILHSYVNSTFTGAASEETALTSSAKIPGKLLAPNCMIEVTLFVDNISDNTDEKDFRIRWGSSAVAQNSTAFGTNTPVYLNNPGRTVSGRLQAAIYTLNATNSQLTVQSNGYGTSHSIAPTPSSIDTTADTYLTPTISLTKASDSVTLVAWTVEIIYP